MSHFNPRKEAAEIFSLWGDAAERVAVKKARWSAEEGDFEKAEEWWEIHQAIRHLIAAASTANKSVA